MLLLDAFVSNQKLLFSVALKLTRNVELAEDALQDAYLRLVNVEVMPPNPVAYMTNAVRSAVLNRVRKFDYRAIEFPTPAENSEFGSFENEKADENADTEAQYLRLEEYWNLKIEIAQLPKKQRAAVEAYLNGINPLEFARQQGLCERGTHANYWHGVYALREKLGA